MSVYLGSINFETSVVFPYPCQSSFFLHLLWHEFITRKHSFFLTVSGLFTFSLLFCVARSHCPEAGLLAQETSKRKSKMIKARHKKRKLDWTKESDKKANTEKKNPQNKVYLSKKAPE